MKYMIMTLASQQDYQAMAGQPAAQPAWTAKGHAAALEAYRAAARAATNLQQQRYLNQQISRLAQGPGAGG